LSRAAFIKRLDELEARLLEAYVPPWRRFLESRSDEELEALERELDPDTACVHYGMGDFVPGCDCLDRARALEPGGRSEVQYLALRLHRGEEAVTGPRPAAETVLPDVPAASPDRGALSPAEEPPAAPEVQERPEERPRTPLVTPKRRIRRSTDLPESKAEERARLFELDTVRLAEPGDVPGSVFGRLLLRRPRRRRSRRF
jgi:hypothetical protein